MSAEVESEDNNTAEAKSTSVEPRDRNAYFRERHKKDREAKQWAVERRRQANAIVKDLTVVDGEEDATVKKEIKRLTPLAVTELRRQLMYSLDEKTRREVARDVLDRAGHTPPQGSVGGGAQVIIVNGMVPGAPLWQQGQVVNGEVKK